MLKTNSINDQPPIITINGQKTTGSMKMLLLPRPQPFKMTVNDQNKSQKSISSSQAGQKNSKPSRLKLKDYLYMAQTSANKNACEKRKILENLSSQRKNTQSQHNKAGLKHSTANLKKSKYCINNSEMFQILRKQIQIEIQSNIEQITTFQSQFEKQVKGTIVPTGSEMMKMYTLRTLLKEKIKNCLKEMRETLQKEQTEQEQGVEIEIELDQKEFGRDIGFTQEIFNKRYLQLQENSHRM